MIFLCRDETCRGNEEAAGDSPEDACCFCGLPLLDGENCVLVMDAEAPLFDVEDAPLVDLVAVEVCGKHGHEFEGRALLVAGRLIGSCSRCGLGIITDGT